MDPHRCIARVSHLTYLSLRTEHKLGFVNNFLAHTIKGHYKELQSTPQVLCVEASNPGWAERSSRVGLDLIRPLTNYCWVLFDWSVLSSFASGVGLSATAPVTQRLLEPLPIYISGTRD